MDKFDDLIKSGKFTTAARHFAKEYYQNCKMGHTRKLLIEKLADLVDEYEKGWVSVKKKLPKCHEKFEDVDVLVCLDDGFVGTATYVKNKGFELWAESGEVTYWRPLPAPPSEKQANAK